MAEPRRFRVSVPQIQAEALTAERTWAEASELLPAFAVALREINFRLTVEPHEWGESREFLPNIRIQLRCGTSRMITVLYGVTEDADEVFVREFRINRNWKPPRPS